MLYSILKSIAKIFIHIKFRIEIIGYEKIPEQNAIIIAANHQSCFDPIILGSIVKREIHFLAKEELFQHGICKWFFGALHAIPVNRHGQNVIRPIRKALKVIHHGNVFGIFPEGKRCKNREIVKPKNGVAFLASKTHAPVLPIAIIGMDKRGFIQSPLKVVIGNPICFYDGCFTDYTKFSQYIMNQIRRLERMK